MRIKIATLVAVVAVLTVTAARPALAQSAGRPVIVEGGGGYTGFIDDATVDHGMFGGGVRWLVTPRLAIGPELVYMIGPGSDRDLFVTGNATFDLRSSGSAPPAVTPYLVFGGGWMHSRIDVGTGRYTYNEGAATAGIGLRITAGDRWFIAPEYRVGWEPHYRIGVQVGVRLK